MIGFVVGLGLGAFGGMALSALLVVAGDRRARIRMAASKERAAEPDTTQRPLGCGANNAFIVGGNVVTVQPGFYSAAELEDALERSMLGRAHLVREGDA